MRRIAAIILWFLAALVPATAQTQFPTYVNGLAGASTPFIGTEFLYMLQSGSSKKATLSNILGQTLISSSGTCSGLNPGQIQTNTNVGGTLLLNVYDGTQCVPFLNINTGTHIPVFTGGIPGVLVVTQPPFNADNTGVADATSAFQNAIAACPTLGCEVWVPQGTYKISTTLQLGTGTSTVVSSIRGTILKGIPNPTYTSGITGYPATNGPRLLWAGGTSSAVVQIAGPIQGWGLENMVIDCNNAGLSTGVQVVSGQFGLAQNNTINNCLNSIAETAWPTTGFSGVSNTNTMHNLWLNTSINMPTTNNAFAVFLSTGSGAISTAFTSFETFINTTIFYPTGTGNNWGLYFQGTADDTFINTHIFGGTNANFGCIGYDYSLPSGSNFPSATNVEAIDLPGCANPWVVGGSPGAGARTHLLTVTGSPSAFNCPTTLANISCQSGNIRQFTSATAGSGAPFSVFSNVAGSINIGTQAAINNLGTLFLGGSGNSGSIQLNGSASGNSTLFAGSTGGLVVNAQPGTTTLFHGGLADAGSILQLVDAGAGSTVANGLQVNGATTTNAPGLVSVGSDTNIGILYETKGTGSHFFINQGNGGSVQMQIGSTGNGTGALLLGGNTSNAVTIATGATGNGLSIDGPAPTCASTGTGTGATCTLSGGSNAVVGSMVLNTGTGPSSSGVATLTAPGAGWTSGSGVMCMGFLDNNGSASWGVNSTLFGTGLTGTSYGFGWANFVGATATALTASTAYRISYLCFGK